MERIVSARLPAARAVEIRSWRDALSIANQNVNAFPDRAAQVSDQGHCVDTLRNSHENVFASGWRCDVRGQGRHAIGETPRIKAAAYSLNAAVLLIEIEADQAGRAEMDSDVESVAVPFCPFGFCQSLPTGCLVPG